MIGERKSNLCYNVPIVLVAHDAQNKHYVIYLEDFVSKVDYNLEFVKKIATDTQDILEAYVNACKIDELLCDNDSRCVSFSQICDNVNNCKDGKDELNCDKVSKCNGNQYRCLNGDCIPTSKYCDSIKDCLDYSDEESCQRDLIVHATRNISCFIKCDHKCIPYDKVCNHITDCSNGEDELDCSNFGLLNKENKPFCLSEGMVNCNSDNICYELYRKCDGFQDCRDGIDEANCEKRDLCSQSDIFKCDSMQKCIKINDRCDGKYDCFDRSDEGRDCINKNYIKTIKIKSMYDSKLELIWVTIEKNIKEKSMLIEGLENCNKYTAVVKISGSTIWRSLQFTYKSSPIKSPKSIGYDYSRFLLYWSYYKEYCIPSLFYIECINRDKIELQTFSTDNYFFVPYNSKLSCRVINFITSHRFLLALSTFSIYPAVVFQLKFTSKFIHVKFLKYICQAYYVLKIVCIALTPIIMIACILYFLQRKRKLFFLSCWKKTRINKAIRMSLKDDQIVNDD
ncbi:hypothetical protein HZS_1857 [Henneguya salminicola]|nr:hypothetical protein HZS_1857 [Henneguya salminicola]